MIWLGTREVLVGSCVPAVSAFWLVQVSHIVGQVVESLVGGLAALDSKDRIIW